MSLGGRSARLCDYSPVSGFWRHAINTPQCGRRFNFSEEKPALAEVESSSVE